MTPAFKLLRQRNGHELELQRFCPERKKKTKIKNQKIMTGISTQFTKGKYFLRFQNNIYYMFFFFTLEPRQKLEVVGGSVASKIFFLSFLKNMPKSSLTNDMYNSVF